uniref:Uncharacterized protein n=1 Tax=Oryza sativa subsp. japonica TaxID=39947 RepID=Q6ZFA3_ORYSJ|nr:hypothetical protein [Oryza sativa Japonica Group]
MAAAATGYLAAEARRRHTCPTAGSDWWRGRQAARGRGRRRRRGGGRKAAPMAGETAGWG